MTMREKRAGLTGAFGASDQLGERERVQDVTSLTIASIFSRVNFISSISSRLAQVNPDVPNSHWVDPKPSNKQLKILPERVEYLKASVWLFFADFQAAESPSGWYISKEPLQVLGYGLFLVVVLPLV
jgi:hypothetical protein